MTLDLLLISISYYLAYWIHFGTLVDILNLDIFLESLPIALAGSYASFFIFGLYREIWQYLDSSDLVRYIKAAAGAVFLIAGVMAILYYPLEISLRIFVIFGLLLLLGLLITRSSFTILDRFTTTSAYHPTKETPVLIYNSEEPGILLKQWLAQDKDQPLKPIGFLDDDPYKVGRQVTGIPVYGRLADIEAISKTLVFEGILLAAGLPLSGERRGDFLKKCASLGIWIKTSRLEFDLIE